MLKITDTVHDFARGTTFEAVMSLPDNVADDYFVDWQPLAMMRRAGQMTKAGLITEFDFKWIGPRQFVLSTDDTDKWPLGMAEFDVLFTSRLGRRIRTKTVTIKITDGVSN